MAKNDVILLDAILDELSPSDIGKDRGEEFERFAFDQLLKDYDLSDDELESGWIDGRDDGGIDGFFIFINGHLLQDEETFVWPRTNASIEVWVLTCKHHATFSQRPLDGLLASIQELFDLALNPGELSGSYSEELLNCRAAFITAYQKLAITRPALHFRFVYASRGDTSGVGDSVLARAAQIETLTGQLFSSCSAMFHFVGAAELVSMFRRTKKFALDLPFVEYLAAGSESYALLATLGDYAKFVTDDAGHLRRYLFDSNVRDYLGESPVNTDIAASLGDDRGPDFWWLNNGVTILATSATVPGKTIQLQDIQIVNGLQTTETIYRHFQSGSRVSAERRLLVKIVVSTNPEIRDRIIRATNNQSLVELSSLHATEKIQRDIEAILERSEWYYERRKNYYRNVGRPPERFVTPLYLAAGFVALVYKHPAAAAVLRSRFMRNSTTYAAVFSDAIDLRVWPAIVAVLKTVEMGLAALPAKTAGHGERFMRNWRGLIGLLVVARVLGKFSFSVSELSAVDLDLVTPERALEVWTQIAGPGGPARSASRPSGSIVARCCEAVASAEHLTDVEVVGRRKLPTASYETELRGLPESFVADIDRLLPPQPWKVGVHIPIAQSMGCRPQQVQAAIAKLIELGKRHEQKDGIVFDKDSIVVAVDHERVANPPPVGSKWR